MLSKNVDLGRPHKLSSWRKIAIGTWRTAGDPSVYGILEIDMGPALKHLEILKETSGKRLTITHLIGKAVAVCLARHPDLNSILRFGKLYPRKNVDVFFQVASDLTGKDLSGTTIRNADKKSIVQIATEMEERVQTIRKKGDPDFKKMKNLMKLIPGFLSGLLLNISGFILYSLNLWSPLLGTPKDPFGSVMITNIGSLGLDVAFAPIVPYSRVPVLIAVGAVRETPVVKNGQVVISPVIKLCATFDHRIIDGVHASHLVKTLKHIFENPQSELF